jgi:hypothetical protein
MKTYCIEMKHCGWFSYEQEDSQLEECPACGSTLLKYDNHYIPVFLKESQDVPSGEDTAFVFGDDEL